MKKRKVVSFVLLLALMLSVFAPVSAFAAEGDNAAYLMVRGENGRIINWSTNEWDPDTTVSALEILTDALSTSGIDYSVEGGSYVTMIDGLSSGALGDNSGWMWYDAGVMATVGANEYEVKDGSTLYWNFESDWQKAGDFVDVTSSWAIDSIQSLKALGVVKGVSYEVVGYDVQGYYAPKNTVTRAEFMQILYNVEGTGEEPTHSAIFSDVGANSWYTDAVIWGYENGVAQGTIGPDGKRYFNPNQTITRQDMAVMLNNYAGDQLEVINATPTAFTDASSIATYAKAAVNDMVSYGVINGVKSADGTYQFLPRAYATRAELASMVSSVVDQLYFE